MSTIQCCDFLSKDKQSPWIAEKCTALQKVLFFRVIQIKFVFFKYIYPAQFMFCNSWIKMTDTMNWFYLPVNLPSAAFKIINVNLWNKWTKFIITSCNIKKTHYILLVCCLLKLWLRNRGDRCHVWYAFFWWGGWSCQI